MMKIRVEYGECAYCGVWRELTHDHVPPQSLFSKPRPSNLITVPSCDACNKGFSKDDEYFQLMVKAGIDQERFPKEVASSIKTINSLAKPERLGFAISLYQKYEMNPSRHNVDVIRIGRTLYRIVRGLFYHHTKIRLAEAVTFRFVSINDEPRKAAAFSDVIPTLTARLTTIGDGVFRYAFEQFQPLTLATIWLITFYDHQRFLCFITPQF